MEERKSTIKPNDEKMPWKEETEKESEQEWMWSAREHGGKTIAQRIRIETEPEKKKPKTA